MHPIDFELSYKVWVIVAVVCNAYAVARAIYTAMGIFRVNSFVELVNKLEEKYSFDAPILPILIVLYTLVGGVLFFISLPISVGCVLISFFLRRMKVDKDGNVKRIFATEDSSGWS